MYSQDNYGRRDIKLHFLSLKSWRATIADTMCFFSSSRKVMTFRRMNVVVKKWKAPILTLAVKWWTPSAVAAISTVANKSLANS